MPLSIDVGLAGIECDLGGGFLRVLKAGLRCQGVSAVSHCEVAQF